MQLLQIGAQEVIVLQIVIGVILFVIARFIMLWYLKINERIKLQRENNLLLRKLLMRMGEKNPDMCYYTKKDYAGIQKSSIHSDEAVSSENYSHIQMNMISEEQYEAEMKNQPSAE